MRRRIGALQAFGIGVAAFLVGGVAEAEMVSLGEIGWQGQIAESYIDTTSIKKDGQFVWFATEIVEREEPSSTVISHARMLFSADCVNRLAREREGWAYILDGETVNLNEKLDFPLERVVPGTGLDNLLDYACSY